MLKDIFASISKPKAGPIEYVIVGLGNPGIQYEGTRHNVGFMVLDYIAKQCNVSIDRMKFKGMTCDTTLNGKRVLLLKPMTYMNLSGDSVRDAMNFYKLTPDRVIVVYDDISLQPGKLRIRLKGSHGGQNGMRSIIEQCGTDTFPRIKMAIGAKPNPGWDLADWVLSKFGTQELKPLEQAIENAYRAAALMVQNKANEAMNQYNS